jgi:hypothetical protein
MPGSGSTQESLSHGHVAAVLGMLRKIGLELVIGSKPARDRDFILAMIFSRIIHPGSKLATLIGLTAGTAQSTLSEELDLGTIETNEFYESLDWPLARQSRIQGELAKKHLADGTLVLFDVSSSYDTGRRSTLSNMGTVETTRKAALRSFTGCFVIETVVQWLSKFSPAIRTIRLRFRSKWPKFVVGFHWSASPPTRRRRGFSSRHHKPGRAHCHTQTFG